MRPASSVISVQTNFSAIVRFLYFALPCLFLISACKRDTNGDLLFEVPYPVVNFVIPAGVPSFQTFVISQNSVPTGLVEAMRVANVTADDIDVYGGLRARVVSLSGEDFSEIERIELRACPVGTAFGCDQASIVFSQSDLYRRRQQSVDLSPQLLNFKNLFLGNDNVRIELVFQPGITTSQTIEARLEWAGAAFGNVD
ncbi:hypothetical protein FUA23_13040 [Neolewinella aurantiaca]|uniref:Uncharacterized protein n=1 Tax=Neolewinella aurantiaca TaxID=2602767 RepID=A0A5C7FTL0_9BACT|nr:hypothetical protein [Neolewinella aurantiaca]TXF88771.1 hypothetical protein FUA23_13040 [Neolewinella aurantiaca]